MPLSEDQKRRIEENRQKALEKRKNLGYKSASNNNQHASKPPTNQHTMRTEPGPGAAWALMKQNQKQKSIPLASASLKSSSSLPVTGSPSRQNKFNEIKVKGTNTTNFYGKSIQAKFLLLDWQSLKVEMNFHPGAITVFKTIQSSRYNATERIWSFSLKDHNELLKGLRPLQPEVQVDPLPKWILETFKSKDDNKHELNICKMI